MDDEGRCHPCSQKGRIYTHASYIGGIAESCLQCGRVVKGDYCYPVCEQPADGSLESETYLENPTSESCKRNFQGEDGNCYKCAHPSNIYIGFDNDRKALCTACGRSINSAEYCISPTNTECEVGTFMDNTQNCVSCNQHISREPIENTTESKNSCLACPGDIEHRVITKGDSSDDDFEIYCTEACYGDMFQSISDGKCHFCSDSSTGRIEIGSDSTSRNYCTACNDRILFTETVNNQVLYYCSAIATDGDSFWDISGHAVRCTDSTNIRLPDYEKAREKCRACGRTVDENTNTCLAHS